MMLSDMDTVLYDTGVDTNDVFVAGCYGFNADYFWYPTFRPSTMTLPFIITLGSIYLGLNLVILHLSSDQQISLTFSAMSLLATLDMGSSLFDLFFGLYASKALFWATFTLILIVPVMYFAFAVIVCQRLLPHSVLDFYVWYNNRVSTTRENGKNELDVKRVVMLIPFVLSMVVLLPYYIVIFVAGAFLYHTKLLAHKDIYNTWVLLFTGRLNSYAKKSIFDTKLLNDAMYLQLLLTSLPLVIIKTVNFMQNESRGLFRSDAYKFYMRHFGLASGVEIADWVLFHSLTPLLNRLLSYFSCRSQNYRCI